MKQAINLVLDEAEVIELRRILIDEDADGALAFLVSQLDQPCPNVPLPFLTERR